MTVIDVPKIVIPPVSLSEAADLPLRASEVADLLEARNQLDVALQKLEEAVALRIAEVRRDGADLLLAIERVRQMGFPLEADKVASPFETRMRDYDRVFDALVERFETFTTLTYREAASDTDEAEFFRDLMRRIRSLAARIRDEFAGVIRLLREAVARVASVHDGLGARSFRAYRHAFSKELPGSEVVGIRSLIHEGDVTPILVVKLAEKQPAWTIVQAEQKVHEQVESIDPALVGIFAIDYLEP